jgi:Transcription factor WhiB
VPQRFPGLVVDTGVIFFDPAGADEDELDVEERHNVALGLCSHCPSADRCREWVDALPISKKPTGVVAGKVIRERRNRDAPRAAS